MKERKMPKRATLLVVMLALMLLALTACGNEENQGQEPGGSGAEMFPAFSGTTLEGEKIDNSIFEKNKVTVVNFWFSDCHYCLEEMGELQALDDSLKEKGGQMLGFNTYTIGGKEKELKRAEDILKENKATYTNFWVAEDSELAKFTESFEHFPDTYVVNSKGEIVGEPIVGSIEKSETMETLQKYIDEALK